MDKKMLLENLYKSHFSGLMRFLRSQKVRKGDEEELAQDVYMRLTQIQDLAAIENPEAFLFTVAANVARDHKKSSRQKLRLMHIPVEEAGDAPQLALDASAVDEEIDVAKQVRRLQEAMKRLPARDRQGFQMQYMEGLSQRDIAERWGVSKTAVVKAMAAAGRRLRERMDGGKGG